MRPAQNNYLLDGIDNNTSNVDFLSGVAYVVKPPIDAVDEIKILTSSFSAEYGRARRRGAQHDAQVGDQQASRQRRGSSTATTALNANDFFANRAGLKKGEYCRTSSGSRAAVRSSRRRRSSSAITKAA